MQGMSRAGMLMLLGVLVFLAPLSGFPIALRALFEFILGAAIFGIGLSMRLRAVRRVHEAANITAETSGENVSAALPSQEIPPM